MVFHCQSFNLSFLNKDISFTMQDNIMKSSTYSLSFNERGVLQISYLALSLDFMFKKKGNFQVNFHSYSLRFFLKI